jgi:glucokinase
MPYGIGIDLGGTNLKVVAASQAGEVLERSSSETLVDSPESWVETIRQRIKEIEETRAEAARWIGVAAPGLASRDSRSIVSMPGKLRGLEELDWTEALRMSHSVPVLNDAHAALLGEFWIGAAVGYRDVVLLTLGTGVGGAVLADGRLYKGHLGRAGHLGHISLNADGAPDIVGTPGSLEQTIGNATLPARSAGRFTSTRELVAAHLSGDEKASDVWLRSVKNLAAGITSIINALDPEVIIIGGGIAQAGAALFDPLAAFMTRFEWRPQGHSVKILPAALGDVAGTLGAVYYAMNCDLTIHS